MQKPEATLEARDNNAEAMDFGPVTGLATVFAPTVIRAKDQADPVKCAGEWPSSLFPRV